VTIRACDLLTAQSEECFASRALRESSSLKVESEGYPEASVYVCVATRRHKQVESNDSQLAHHSTY
jgi:hypothetical protein